MGLKKINGNERYMLKGSLRKNGFDRWRLVTSGFNKTTGEERTFLIEFYVVNPALSPKEVVLGFKSRKAQSAADLQYALAGTQAAINIQSEKYVQPSFVMVKAGVLGRGGKQINAYFPCSSLQVGKNDFIVKVSSGTDEECFLSDGECYGSVSVSQAQLNDMPELLSQAGLMAWNLKFKKQISFSPDYKGKGIHWSSFGGRTVFEGKVLLDGEEYVVIPKKSYGYVDKNWGKDFTSPFFHLSASNFTSLINGKSLDCSCLAVQGVYNERLSVLSSIEGNKIEFHADSHKKYTISFECTEMPEDDDGIKLHWTVSVHDRKRVLDIDIFCNTDEMFIRDYESPEGGRKLLKILGGGTGSGEMRLYKKIKKNLELIEYVRVANCVCEYGNIDLPET